jgi:hypothetical protein
MADGTPIVRNLPLTFDRAVPEGEPLFPGDPKVVEAWHRKARRDLRTARAFSMAFAAIWVFGAIGEVVPLWAAVAALAAVGALLPVAALSANGRGAQRPFDIFEKGVHGTQRKGPFRMRRFAPFPEVVGGTEREVAPGRHAVTLTLMDASKLESIPGEVSRGAVEYLRERTGDQLRTQHR